MPLTISRLTREYIFSDLVTDDDLAGATAEATFQDPDVIPEEVDWETADLVSDNGEWSVRILVGPGGTIELTAQEYPHDFQMWIRITDNPERPVRRPGIVTVD